MDHLRYSGLPFEPFGLTDIFSFRLMPNRVLDNRRSYAEKAARTRQNWPEIEVVPW